MKLLPTELLILMTYVPQRAMRRWLFLSLRSHC